MRIIGGSHAGLRLQPPTSLPVRPTTDMAKEALFNVLQHRIDFEGTDVLDLCAGTGNVTLEIASRGAARVIAVARSEEHTSELQSLMSISYAVLCLKHKIIYH